MEHDSYAEILAEIEAGNHEAARTALKALLLKADAPDHELLYLLGRCFFDEDKGTARYLFESALAIKPDYQDAGRYEARCGSSLEDLEDFHDHRHPPCGACDLHYRDRDLCCPYCGAMAQATNESSTSGAFEEQLKEAGKDVIDAFKEFTDREDVKAAKEKLTAAGRQAYVKAKEFGESDQAKELKATARAFGLVAARKAKEIGSSKEVRNVKERATNMGHDAAEKAKAFSEREDVKEAVEKASETSKNVMAKTAAYASAEIRRINAAEGAMKWILIGKWVALVLAILFALNWLFSGE